jgi:hypothetical protein
MDIHPALDAVDTGGEPVVSGVLVDDLSDPVRQIPAHARDGDLKIRDLRLDLTEPLAVLGPSRADSRKVLDDEAFNPVGNCRPSTTLTTW